MARAPGSSRRAARRVLSPSRGMQRAKALVHVLVPAHMAMMLADAVGPAGSVIALEADARYAELAARNAAPTAWSTSPACARRWPATAARSPSRWR